MKNTIGIKMDEGIKQEIILESMKVLAVIEKKYNCKFEFYKELGSSKLKLKMPKIKKGGSSKGLYSFGGEMDI
jgi:hypothetical protein